MTGAARADRAEIERALAVLFEPGQVVELRALEVADGPRKRTYSGYFDSMEELAEAAAKLSGRAKGVYVTVNEVDPALLARRTNRVAGAGDTDPTTSDNNIVRRRWLLIDVDPHRPSGISSTQAEHELAISRASEIADGLAAMGWPEPILGDSGNGAHVLYRVELPRDDDGLVKWCLEALHERFGDDQLSIDRTVYNPARIWKLYGTLACKGDDSPERSHRLARLFNVPKELKVVPNELLRALAEPMEKLARAKQKKTRKPTGGGFRLEDWIAAHGLDLAGPKPWNGGELWEFKVCPWNPEHTNGSAFIGRLAEGAITAGCHHDGCTGQDWQSLRHLLDGTDGSDAGGPNEKRESQATRLLALVEESEAELWHTPGGEPYVSVRINGYRESFALKGKRADYWLRHLFYEANSGTAPGSQAISDVLNVLRSNALFDGEQHDVFVRVGVAGDEIYVDLGSSNWSAVRINASGWEIIEDCPVRFRRPKGMLPLPEPRRGGQLARLRPFLNVETDDDFRLVLSLLVGMVWPTGPYPVVVLQGEQGSAKSTTGEVIGRLIDPAIPALRSQPRDGHDLMIAASNRWVLAFDNLSDIPVWLSDALCRISTGGGFATRELYSDDEEALFDVERPVILTGIDELITRSDLLDRAVLLLLPHIDDGVRRTEEEFWKRFDEAWPSLLGALFDAAFEAKKNIADIRIPRLPRLADFARRAAAAAPSLGWSAQQFLDAYEQNRRVGHVTAIEASAVAKAVTELLVARDSWKGTASELLAELNEQPAKKPKTWPRSALAISNAVRRVAPNLREVGIRVEFERGTDRNRTRTIEISRLHEEEGAEASTASEASSSDSNSADARSGRCEEASEGASAQFRFDSDDVDAADDLTPPSARAEMKGERYVTCPGCGERPAREGGLCFRCSADAEAKP